MPQYVSIDGNKKIVSFGNENLLAPSTPMTTMALQELELLPLQISQISLVIRICFGSPTWQCPDFFLHHKCYLSSQKNAPKTLLRISARSIRCIKVSPERRTTRQRWRPAAPPRLTCSGASPRRAIRRGRARPLRDRKSVV